MQTRKLGRTDLELTTVGLGTWAMGGPWQFGWGPQDDSESIAAIHRSIERGINWIDTAPIYGMGHSEEIVARALKEMGSSKRPLVFTKCSIVVNAGMTRIEMEGMPIPLPMTETRFPWDVPVYPSMPRT